MNLVHILGKFQENIQFLIFIRLTLKSRILGIIQITNNR